MATRDVELEEPELSEGEKFIEEFFLDEKIKYLTQKKVPVSGDTKAFRVADFYLPKYDVYVEFFGRWNDSKEERLRYREKKGVYYRNRIPCIYLYPENLGILDHVFHYRMKKVLKEHNMRKQLRSYLFDDFNRYHAEGLPYLFISLFLFVLFFVLGLDFVSTLLATWALSLVWVAVKYVYELLLFFKDRDYSYSRKSSS